MDQENKVLYKTKEKKPEILRYQPSSFRSIHGIDSKDTKNIDSLHVPVLTESSKAKIAKDEKLDNYFTKHLNDPNTASTLDISSNRARGLLKINSITLNDLIAENEKLCLNEIISENSKEKKNISNKDKEEIKPNNSKSYKMLYDPHNPNKPIYVIDNKDLCKNHIRNHKSSESTAKKFGKIDSESILESTFSLNTSKMNDIIRIIKKNEQLLKNLYENFDSNKSLSSFCSEIYSLRKNMEDLYIDALFTHLEIFINSNLDLNHWKICYHQLIELLRRELNNNRSNNKTNIDNEIKNYLDEYIDNGVCFYNNLIDILETRVLKFKIHLLFDLNNYEYLIKNANQFQKHFDTTIKTKDMKYALLCIHRLLISLGDLARYKEMISDTSSFSNKDLKLQRDYSVARTYYLKAKIIQPKSSLSYHQLAIISIYTKKRLDACYYYFRCLEVSNPLLTVKQSLNSIFEEVRIKSDSIVKNYKESIEYKNSKQARRDNNENKKNINKNRIEIWFKPSPSQKNNSKTQKISENKNISSSSENEDDTYSDEDNNFDVSNNHIKFNNQEKMSTNELNKIFILNYLNTIGKLFNKVGMETYDDLFVLMLNEFEQLLKKEVCPLGKIGFLQITVINISLIDLNNKSTTNNYENSKNLQLEYAIQLSIDIFIIMVKRFNKYLSKSIRNDEFNDNLWNVLLPSIKVFIDWMTSNTKIWYKFTNKIENKINQNRWNLMCDMFNLVNKYNEKNKKEDLTLTNDYLDKIKLEEDIELAGFLPLLSLTKEDYDYQTNSTNLNSILNHLNEQKVIKAKIKKRMNKLCNFADYLCGLEEPLLKFDVLNKLYNTISTNHTNKDDFNMLINSQRTETDSESLKTDSIIQKNEKNDVIQNIKTNKLEDNNHDLYELKEKRKILKAKMDQQNFKEKSHKSLVEMNIKRRLELEIRPKFIIPDTNCFIDFLDFIEKILEISDYIMIVPLLVINELEKLSKNVSNSNDDSIEHAEYVQQNARKAIKYLNEKFEKREKNLKAITSQGSVLETINFKSEEVKKQGNTDELILGCCLHYCRDNANDFLPSDKNDVIHLFRDVVLLTDDRHLRLKAHTRNVPVKNIKQFVKWSNL